MTDRPKQLQSVIAWPREAFADKAVPVVFTLEQAVQSFGMVPKPEIGIRLDTMVVRWLDTVGDAREFYK